MSDDPYWQELRPASTLELASFRAPQPTFFRVHQEEEEYDDLFLAREFDLQLSEAWGRRNYVHVRPVVFTPRIILDVAVLLSEFNQDFDPGTPHPSSPVGVVLGSRTDGEEQIAIGNGQAWEYPCDRLLILWEMELFHSSDRRAGGAPSEMLATLWRDFETLLLTRFPLTEKILTPAWEPAFESNKWQEFLNKLGYVQDPTIENAFFKNVSRVNRNHSKDFNR